MQPLLDVAKLSDAQLKQFRQLLLTKVAEQFRSVHDDLRHLEPGPPDDVRDEGDESLAMQLRDLALSLDEREAALAQRMEEALRRIARGEYGECVDCGGDIELGRLKAVPWTLRCIDCQEAFEQEIQSRPPTL